MSSKNHAVATTDSDTAQAPDSKRPGRSRNVIVLVVIIAFLALILVKVLADSAAPTTAPDTGTSAGASITSVHNDAVADYEAALASGKPVYVLFHSLTCEPCVEISAVADQVMPEYGEKVVFVNVITDDPSGQQLAASFSFQYIPTSFFLEPGGKVADSFTGAMDAAQMRGYLDALLADK